MQCKYNQMDGLKEECGVFGVYGTCDLDLEQATYYSIYALQHRGQQSAGIAIYDGKDIRSVKGAGLVNEVFNEGHMEDLAGGHIAIGHVRYASKKQGDAINAQPLVIRRPRGKIALGFSGALVNGDALRDEMQMQGVMFQTDTDAEIVAALICKNQELSPVDAFCKIANQLSGAFTLTMLGENSLIGIRDPAGIRPLVLGQIGEGCYVLASETAAFDVIGAKLIRDVEPGEVIEINENGIKSYYPFEKKKTALCLFEYVYFARPDSYMDGVSVYASRRKAGRLLAEVLPVEADFIAGVPESAQAAAKGYSEASGIPLTDGVIKNKYSGRAFIAPKQSLREVAVLMKLNALSENVKGKRIILIDDSIVRGTTSKKIVQMVRDAGATEVHMRISSPAIIYPCPLGIDTATADQLISSYYDAEQICKKIGADSLAFLPIDKLIESVGEEGGYCTGCFDGNYGVEGIEIE